MAKLPLSSGSPFNLVALKDDASVFLPAIGVDNLVSGLHRCYLFGPTKPYLRGETVNLRCWIRTTTPNVDVPLAYPSPSRGEFAYVLRDGSGKSLVTELLVVGERGLAKLNVEIPHTMPIGMAELCVYSKHYPDPLTTLTIDIEKEASAAFELRPKALNETCYIGEELDIALRVLYPTGEKAPDVNVAWSYCWNLIEFDPPGSSIAPVPLSIFSHQSIKMYYFVLFRSLGSHTRNS